MTKEDFKNFVRTKPELIDYIEDNSMTWQKFYEIYDMYGADDEIWNRYKGLKKQPKVSDFMQNLDVDNLKSHIETAQKALSVISELTTKGTEAVGNVIKPKSPRPITKFFGD